MNGDLLFILSCFVFALGACIASFLNVVIWRMPRGESIVSPPSHCPKCGAPIRWYQNIPILSWLCLRGKCAACKAPISPRYIIIETIGGLLFLFVFLHLGVPMSWIPALEMVVWMIWVSFMIVGAMIDYDHKLLPDFVTIGGMVLGVIFYASVTVYGYFVGRLGVWMNWPVVVSLFGLVFGFGLLWLVRFFGSKVFKREAMGEGDVFLMGAVGAMFGPVAVLFTLIVSSVIGSIFGVSQIFLRKIKLGDFTEIPYGPYIYLGSLVWMFRGPELVESYLRLLGGS